MASIDESARAIHEAALRRRLREHGWRLQQLRRVNRECPYGRAYAVTDPRWALPIFGGPYGSSLGAIEAWLADFESRTPQT
jgi:hypothetical protein